MTRRPLHLTERGEWVKTLIEGVLVIIILPASTAVIIYTVVGR